MRKIEELSDILFYKLEEYAISEYNAEIIVDVFLNTISNENYTSDDKIKILEKVKKYLTDKNTFTFKVVDYNCRALKINEGY